MARKVKPSSPTSPAVQEYIKQQEAKAAQQSGAAKPPAPSAPPSGPPPPIAPFDPMAAARTPVTPRPASSSASSEGLLAGKSIAIVVGLIVIAGGVFGFFMLAGRSATATPELGAAEINQLRQGMTPEQAQAILGKPTSARTGTTSRREAGVDQIMQAGFYEYYRKSTLMLVYDKTDHKLIEVCIGETPDEYEKRKVKKETVLWEAYPETGFIHQDVWRPNSPSG